MGIPTGPLAALVACKNGVKHAYLVDAPVYGSLMLELHSQDGESTILVSDFHENGECWW